MKKKLFRERRKAVKPVEVFVGYTQVIEEQKTDKPKRKKKVEK